VSAFELQYVTVMIQGEKSSQKLVSGSHCQMDVENYDNMQLKCQLYANRALTTGPKHSLQPSSDNHQSD